MHLFIFVWTPKESVDPFFFFLFWIPLDHWKIFSLTNIFLLKVWECCIFKNEEDGDSNGMIIKKYWKLLLHFSSAAICALTLGSLRVRLIKPHRSCNALWAVHRCGSHQSAAITCSVPAPDKWQPTRSLQPLVPSGLLINVSANQPLSEKSAKRNAPAASCSDEPRRDVCQSDLRRCCLTCC